jgi:hypothetical protein
MISIVPLCGNHHDVVDFPAGQVKVMDGDCRDSGVMDGNH